MSDLLSSTDPKWANTSRRVVAISDTHGRHAGWDIPDGDILIHSGDLTVWGKEREVQDGLDWFNSLPHKRKLLVPGNHDFLFERDYPKVLEMLRKMRIAVLIDTGISFMALAIWGSPWAKTRSHRWAFDNPGTDAICPKWDKIPDGLDILVTHSPPHGILDEAPPSGSVGCEYLTKAVLRAKPKYHIFGHIHEGAGMKKVGDTTFINASTCDSFYNPVHPPSVIDF